MFITLNLARIYHRNHYQWTRKLLKFQTPASNPLLWQQRHCCDIKRNEELLFSSGGSGVIIPTPLKIKQTLKSGFHDLIDGFTCIQTSCPACPKDASPISGTAAAATAITAHSKTDDKAQTTADKCLFINKTTGNLAFTFVYLAHVMLKHSVAFKRVVKCPFVNVF